MKYLNLATSVTFQLNNRTTFHTETGGVDIYRVVVCLCVHRSLC
jgi:hypothetical protein